MVIISFDGFRGLLKANVIESGEGGAVDVFDGVVGHEEHLLPPHEHKVRVVERVVIETVQIESLGVLEEAEELAPVLPIHLLVRVPLASQEREFAAYNFPHETRRQRTELLRQTVNLKMWKVAREI